MAKKFTINLAAETTTVATKQTTAIDKLITKISTIVYTRLQ